MKPAQARKFGLQRRAGTHAQQQAGARQPEHRLARLRVRRTIETARKAASWTQRGLGRDALDRDEQFGRGAEHGMLVLPLPRFHRRTVDRHGSVGEATALRPLARNAVPHIVAARRFGTRRAHEDETYRNRSGCGAHDELPAVPAPEVVGR